MRYTLKHKFAILIVCIILLSAMCAILLSGITDIAVAYAQENKIISEINSYDTLAQNRNLYTLVNKHIDVNMGDLSIAAVKDLQDFDGNGFTLFELAPTGYIIYHNDSGEFVEYAAGSPSPYTGMSGDLYYGGMTEYYCKQGDTLTHTLDSSLSFNASEISSIAVYSGEIAERLNADIKQDYLDFINGKTSSCEVEVIRSEPAATRASNSARISMTDFFPRLINENQFGYVNTGACGYIATNLILAYNYFSYDYGLVNPEYVDFGNKCLKGNLLTKYLITLDGHDPNQYLEGTTATTIFNMFDSYMNQVNNYYAWTWSWRLFDIDAKVTIDSGFPVVLFGSLIMPDGSGRGNHAVVAYDYSDKYYRAHFGWSNQADIWLKGALIGTDFFMKLS